MMNTNQRAPKRRTPVQRQERVKKSRLPEVTPDTPWRLFVAVPLPREVRDQMRDIAEHLQDSEMPVRWADPDNGHLTLHFLGELDPEMAELLRMVLGAAISPHAPFDLRTAEPGAFPSLKRPRVLWLGLWGPAHRLESIYNDIGDFLDDFGIEIEDADFHPHITLGRLRDTEGVRIGALPEQVREAFASITSAGLAGSSRQVPLPVTEIQLVRSFLEQSGPRYEVLATYQLQGDPEAPVPTPE